MKLRLTLRKPDRDVNLNISVDATATVGDVAAALGAAAPDKPGLALDPAKTTLRLYDQAGQIARDLEPQTMLVESGLRSGSVVMVAPVSGSGPNRRLRLAGHVLILDGPDRGARFEIPFGSCEVGRLPGMTVRLNDPLVSKRHMRIIVGDGIEVHDLNSANGVLVGDRRVQRARVGPSDVIAIGDTTMQIVQVRPPHEDELSTVDIAFVRPPQVVPRVPKTKIPLPKPPNRKERQPLPVLAMLVPPLMGVVLFYFTNSVLSVVFMALTPLFLIGAWLDDRVRVRRENKQAKKRYLEAIASTRQRLSQAYDIEREVRLAQQPDVVSVVDQALKLMPALWSRRPEHDQFLRVRLGLGADVPITLLDAEFEASDQPDLNKIAADLAEEFRWIPDVPIVASLRQDGSLGVYGEPTTLMGVAHSIVAQLVCLHSPAEVSLACLTSSSNCDRWRWLEWLPHTSSPHSPLSGTHLAADSATSDVLLNSIEGLIAARRKDAKRPVLRGAVDPTQPKEDPPVVPTLILLVDGAMVDHARLNRVVEAGPDVGVYTVFVAEHLSQIPAACRSFVSVGPEQGYVGKVRDALNYAPVRLELLSQDQANRIGRILAPVVDAGVPVDDDSDLPHSISFVTLTGHELADSATAQIERWRANNSLIDRTQTVPLKQPVALSALVGQGAASPLALDLRTHGPHALVGGTTGAGKSEFLQAWVLGMAQALSPDRVTFLFVDYKGGSAFARCTDLPHCVGLVTDLSPHLVRRALTSLRAELHYREHLLNRKGAKDLVTLEKAGDPECPPSLIIVVDEFAALVGEVPEFVDGVVDVGQRGRSLGLHLVLATQRPAGVIKDSLRANTNLRVALRVADESDSQDVLDDKLAAHFDPGTPGRAAAKTGPGRIMQFQSAYPGAKTVKEASSVPILVEEMTFGLGQPWRVPVPVINTDAVASDIDRVVTTVSAAFEQAGLPRPRLPWQPELAPTYDLNRLNQRRDTALALGVVDDPASQTQRTEYFHPDTEGNIAYFGAGGSGKTTALRMLAVAAAITPRSGGVQVYGLDFAGGGLSMLEPLPHVGAIIPGDDDELVARLVKFLAETVAERMERYSAVRATTITQYRQVVGSLDEQRILVLIDGMGTFRKEYETQMPRLAVFERLQQIMVDGRGVGVHVAISADRLQAVPNTMLSSFQRRIVLRQAEADAYLDFNLPRDVLSPASPPGRAMQVGNPQELQLAILGDNVNSVTQARLIEGLAEFLRGQGRPAPVQIRKLPAEIPAAEVPPQTGGLPTLGIASETLSPVAFSPVGVIVVAGGPRSGRTNAISWMARTLRAWDPSLPMAHLSAGRSGLGQLGLWQRSVSGESAVGELLPMLSEYAARPAPADRPGMALFIEGYGQFVDSSLEYELADLVKRLRLNGHLVVAESETSEWNSGGPLPQEAKNQRTGLILQPESYDGESLLRIETPPVKPREMPPGRGYWIADGKPVKVQVPLVDS